jgi:hypothetical protein
MGERRVAALPAGVDGPGTGEGEARGLQGADANPMAPPKLVPRAFGAGGWTIEGFVPALTHTCMIRVESLRSVRSDETVSCTLWHI